MDLEIRQFSNYIINIINSYNLPIEVKRLVLHSITDKIELEADRVIRDQMEQLQISNNKQNEELTNKIENEETK